MALQGTIETFALPDVLRLLASSNKTGKLAVDGDRGLGALWVDEGDIIASEIDLGTHPSTGSTDVSEGLFQLLRFEKGEFVFTSDEAPTSTDGRFDVESTIDTSSEMLASFDEITSNVPSIASHVELRPELNADGVTLSAEQWRVLAAVGSGSSVADIASTFSFGELDAMRRIDDLVSEGVVDVSEAPAEPVAEFEPEEASAGDVEETPVEDAFAVDAETFESTDAPLAVEETDSSPQAAEAVEDPFAAALDAPALTDSEDPFAAVAETEDPFAAPVEADDPFAPVAEADAHDPFAPAEAEAAVADDPFAPAPVAEADAPDPFAGAQPDIEVAPETAEFDPFAPAAEADVADDSAGVDPFAPAAAVAAGATGGVLHDVFGNSEADVDESWEPPVDETVAQAPVEWPAPNASSDADAPWSDEGASQLPPPPAPTGFATADDAASQLPPPPAMATEAGLDDAAVVAEPAEPFADAPESLSAAVDQTAGSELPPPPAFDAPEAEVAGVPSFPEAPPVPETQSVASESNDMARQLASLSPSAARAVANAAKAETPEARDAALAEVEAEDSSVDRSLLLRFLGKSDKKDS